MTKMRQWQCPGATTRWCGSEQLLERVEGASCFYQYNCHFSIMSLADKLHLALSHYLSLTSNLKSIQLDLWRQLGADAGGHALLHSHNGLWHNWGPRNWQHSWCFQEASCLQVTSNSSCPRLSALTKKKECFPPQHGCVGIKTHSEWPRVA